MPTRPLSGPDEAEYVSTFDNDWDIEVCELEADEPPVEVFVVMILTLFIEAPKLAR